MPLGERKLRTEAVIAELAARQDGVVSRRQLLQARVGSTAITDRVRAGLLVPVFRGVYSLGPPSRRGRLRAALLAVGDGAVLSHRAAGWMHELVARPPAEVDITTTRSAESRPGIVLHRARALPAAETCVVAGLPCTSVARTLIDLAGTQPRRVVERAIDEAELRRSYDGYAIGAAMRRGRNGVAALRAIAAEHAPETTITRSALEEAFLALCRRERIARPVMNAPLVLPGGRALSIDALWPAQRVAVELDGRCAHLRRKAFEADRVRDVELTLAGHRPVRFTWRKIAREPRWVAAKLAALLARKE